MGVNFSSPASGAASQRKNGHVYTSVVTRDNARAHYGDNITTVRNYHTSVSLWPPSPSARDAELPCCEQRITKRKRTSDTDVESSLRKGQDPVNMAIDHLGELYLSMRHLEKDRDAQKLVQWIRVLLDTFTKETDGSRLGHTYEELESLQNGLLQVNRVSVNSVSNSRRTMPAHLIGFKRQRSVIDLGTWKIQLDTVSRESIDTTGSDVSESFSSLRLKSTRSPGLSQSSISAFFGERTDYSQRSFLSPTIIVYRTVESSSEVFKLVRDDDVDGLMRLFALQKASARDCDPYGRSLFFVSILVLTNKYFWEVLTCIAGMLSLQSTVL